MAVAHLEAVQEDDRHRFLQHQECERAEEEHRAARSTQPTTSRFSRKVLSSVTIAFDCPGTSHSR